MTDRECPFHLLRACRIGGVSRLSWSACFALSSPVGRPSSVGAPILAPTSTMSMHASFRGGGCTRGGMAQQDAKGVTSDSLADCSCRATSRSSRWREQTCASVKPSDQDDRFGQSQQHETKHNSGGKHCKHDSIILFTGRRCFRRRCCFSRRSSRTSAAPFDQLASGRRECLNVCVWSTMPIGRAADVRAFAVRWFALLSVTLSAQVLARLGDSSLEHDSVTAVSAAHTILRLQLHVVAAGRKETEKQHMYMAVSAVTTIGSPVRLQRARASAVRSESDQSAQM